MTSASSTSRLGRSSTSVMTARSMPRRPSHPDGRYVLFSSDRTAGIANILAYELETQGGCVSQVTNVLYRRIHAGGVPTTAKHSLYVGYGTN